MWTAGSPAACGAREAAAVTAGSSRDGGGVSAAWAWGRGWSAEGGKGAANTSPAIAATDMARAGGASAVDAASPACPSGVPEACPSVIPVMPAAPEAMTEAMTGMGCEALGTMGSTPG
ncbi:hypothetical protein JCM12296A_37820 [Desulfosarcina cetonica]